MGVELREKNGSILHRTTECDPLAHWTDGRTDRSRGGSRNGTDQSGIVALCSRAAAERKLNNGFPLPPAISWVDCHSRDRVTLQSYSDRPPRRVHANSIMVTPTGIVWYFLMCSYFLKQLVPELIVHFKVPDLWNQ